MNKLVYGVALNDADYKVIKKINGKSVWCPYYRTWVDMVRRVYCDNMKIDRPTYSDVTLCEDWHTFTKFKSWMEEQNWEENELDKDLMLNDNKQYGPDRCVFVSKSVNLFMTEMNARRGEFPIGVSWHKLSGKYQSRVRLLGKGQKHLGLFNTPHEAHAVYWKAKCDMAKELAYLQTDKRVADALLIRYSV